MRRREAVTRLGSGLAAFAAVARRREAAQTRTPVIDGLGEVRPEYGRALLDEIRRSGLSGCLVTVGNPALQGDSAWGDMETEITRYNEFVRANPVHLATVLDAAGIERATATRRIGLLYYVQNASPIGDQVDRVGDMKRLGVRVVQLTYNTRNLLGDGCLERTDSGLSRFGLEVVERLTGSKMLICVSHSGEATSLDAIEHSTLPIAITHSGCRAVFNHPRNKTDRVLKAMADRGGVVGIYQLNPYLGPNERNTLDDYLAHLEHAIRVAGVEHVGIGSDREYQTIPDTDAERERLRAELSRLRPTTAAGFRWPFFVAALNHPRRMETIADSLRQKGHSAHEVDLVLGGNFLRLIGDTIG